MCPDFSRSNVIFAILFFLPLTVAAEETVKVADEAASTRPLRVGQSVPEVSLMDPAGRTVTLRSLRQERPTVLVFFRGGWCPICTRHTGELIRVYPKIREMGAELVAISPDSPASSKKNVDENAIPFPVLSDASAEAARAFGLAFRVDPAALQRYRGFGIDLEKASGHDHHLLPVPAIFIVDQGGNVVFAHSDPDYRRRLPAETLLQHLREL